jgi:hypothetical protein
MVGRMVGERPPESGRDMGESTMIWLVAFGVCLAVILLYQALRKLDRLASNFPQESYDSRHDQRITEEISTVVESYTERLRHLKAEKDELPPIDPWAINSNANWERDLIAGAENLRGYIVEAYGLETPDTYHVQQIAQTIPITYPLAHDLAALAHQTYELTIKRVEWHIKKVELLGLMRKRACDLAAVASEEFELREIEREIQSLRDGLPAWKKAVWEQACEAEKQRVGVRRA